ncbi:flagellar basal body-associated FliL family protein [Cognatishimia sp. SS12]|uniref:flagellar basal body-associated FliL family protein n=1 Tax=Cognatishimia sp. SS12 TaxID=2979465 RepID=UPI00232DEFBA|nr:flagellar basal body-associated FliL family protein [Cognatishimia sp. SS12]MDC0739417.1 flagellar basal body-associated FliL family protein [Cognatishimia sp. SS12]
MAKAPQKAKDAPAAEADKAAGDAPKSSKKLLLAAVALSLLSLGGGFFLARMAFQQDAKQYEPDYVEEVEPVAADSKDAKGSTSADDPYAVEEASAKGEGEEAAPDVNEGMLSFDEILTNITSVNAQGVPRNAFLKLKLTLVYRPDEGAQALMEKRQPFMRDLFNGYARSLTEADVRGMAGILNVKAELLKRARAAAGSDLPQEILISDLIVQ